MLETFCRFMIPSLSNFMQRILVDSSPHNTTHCFSKKSQLNWLIVNQKRIFACAVHDTCKLGPHWALTWS